SAIVAGLFGLHPLHVESVAWVAERKDVLSTFFFILTLLAYVAYARHCAIQNENTTAKERLVSWGRKQHAYYALTVICLALGLLSKPMLVTLPFVLLLIDYWPLQRVSRIQDLKSKTGRRLIIEKVPFFGLSAASCAVTYLAQRAGGAVDTLERVPLSAR